MLWIRTFGLYNNDDNNSWCTLAPSQLLLPMVHFYISRLSMSFAHYLSIFLENCRSWYLLRFYYYGYRILTPKFIVANTVISLRLIDQGQRICVWLEWSFPMGEFELRLETINTVFTYDTLHLVIFYVQGRILYFPRLFKFVTHSFNILVQNFSFEMCM